MIGAGNALTDVAGVFDAGGALGNKAWITITNGCTSVVETGAVTGAGDVLAYVFRCRTTDHRDGQHGQTAAGQPEMILRPHVLRSFQMNPQMNPK